MAWFLRAALFLLVHLSGSVRKVRSQCCEWKDNEADCYRLNLTRIPHGLPQNLKTIDLGNNLIGNLTDFAFKDFPKLKDLKLPGNKIVYFSEKSFAGLPNLEKINLEDTDLSVIPTLALKELERLKILNLRHNNITKLPSKAFDGLRRLESLELFSNRIETIAEDAFQGIEALEFLDLKNNRLTSVPVKALAVLNELTSLDLRENPIAADVPKHAFAGLKELSTLDIDWSNVKKIHPDAFALMPEIRKIAVDRVPLKKFPNLTGTSRLEALTLTNCQITSSIPHGFCSHKKHLAVLSMNFNSMRELPSFSGCKELSIIKLDHNEIDSIGSSFSNMAKLKDLTLKGNNIRRIERDAFSGNSNLETLNLFDNHIEVIEGKAFSSCDNLKVLTLRSNQIVTIPKATFQGLNSLESLTLADNRITHIESRAFSPLKRVRELDLDDNLIDVIEDEAFSSCDNLQTLTLKSNNLVNIQSKTFHGLKTLKSLDLAHNRITHIDAYAFSSCERIRELNLSFNAFPSLPSQGLEKLVTLSVKENRKLEDFPAEELPSIRKVEAYYPYHCCHYRNEPSTEIATSDSVKSDRWTWGEYSEVDFMKFENASGSGSAIYPGLDELSGFGSGMPDPAAVDASALGQPGEMYSSADGDGESAAPRNGPRRGVTCTPSPDDPFFPCDDLMDSAWLRYGVWIVFLLALLGNAVVIFVIIATRSRLDVPRFLICNLAFADLCMGVYLGMLAFVDASTLGNFRSYGVHWQLSTGCRAAGFLAVLSSESSVFTLAIITIERMIAITHALDVTKRLTLRNTVLFMVVGWIFAVVMATLPLFQISDYAKFSVCLPFEIGTPGSLVYVTFLLVANMSAFVVILSCYIRIYCAIRGSNAWNTNDWRVAQRMSLLVITDFLCWAPIVVLSLTAAFGSSPLINLKHAKIFTVFLFPLNSCANPFLYAITTSQFKKDCMFLCRRVKHSHVTRIPSVRRKFSLTLADTRSTTISDSVYGKYRIREMRRNSVPATMKFSVAPTSPAKPIDWINAIKEGKSEKESVDKETCL